MKLVQGNASNYYNDLREKIIKSLAFIEAKIDFSELAGWPAWGHSEGQGGVN